MSNSTNDTRLPTHAELSAEFRELLASDVKMGAEERRVLEALIGSLEADDSRKAEISARFRRDLAGDHQMGDQERTLVNALAYVFAVKPEEDGGNINRPTWPQTG